MGTLLLSVTAASASECLDAINKYRGMGGKSDVAACADLAIHCSLFWNNGTTCTTWDDVVACWYYEGTSYSNECCTAASTTQHKDQLLADHKCAACGFATEGSKWMYTATFCNSNSKSPEIGG